LTIRLTDAELAALDKNASASGAESRSEFIRLLLHRESNRRSGLKKPRPFEWQGAFRVGGRPYKNKTETI